MSYQSYIKKIRADYNLTQKELSDATGISVANIKKIEAGVSETPNEKAVIGLCNFLHCSAIALNQKISFSGFDPYTKIIEERGCVFLEWFISQTYVEGNSKHSFMCNEYTCSIPTQGEVKYYLPSLIDSGKKDYHLLFAPQFDLFGQEYPDDINVYINDILAKALWTADLPAFRYIEFVFDALNEKDMEYFRKLKDIKLNYSSLKIGFVYTLYDYKECLIKEQVLINIKKI